MQRESIDPAEGYVLTSYGPEKYLHHAVASVTTLRRHDTKRPVALYCTEAHRALLEEHRLNDLFDRIEILPEAHRSIVGVKHALHFFMPFERNLFVDSDLVWCRNPDPLWRSLSAYPFTATGLERADIWFGGPKGAGIVLDYLLDTRRRTIRRFGLTHLPRVQSGLMYAQDRELTRSVCETAAEFLTQQHRTHFRSRKQEKGRNLESCEWSLAMAMSKLQVQVFPWFNGHDSPQLDFIDSLTSHDPDFSRVRCRYYSNRFVYSLRGIPDATLRATLLRLATLLPGRNDFMEVTPFALHFGWLHQKQPFLNFAEDVWQELTGAAPSRNAVATAQ